MHLKYAWALGALAMFAACGQQEPRSYEYAGASNTSALLTEPVRVAFVGDYGVASAAARGAMGSLMAGRTHDPRAEGDVAALVHRQHPAYVFTSGDNNYPCGSATTLDDNVGQFYSDFIAPYRGRFGYGARVNRFFPALGNHDWEAPGAEPHLNYFELPNNGRYYDVPWAPCTCL